jgi:6-phosphofructokinase 2
VLDCSGEALLGALGPELEIVKVNEAELQEVTGAPVNDREQCAAAARLVLASGVKMVALTRGSRGALLVTKDETWEASAPAVCAATTVGAGDSFMAALVWSLAGHKSAAQALRMAVAAGSAALIAEGTGLATAMHIESLLDSVQLRRVELPKTYAMTGG